MKSAAGNVPMFDPDAIERRLRLGPVSPIRPFRPFPRRLRLVAVRKHLTQRLFS
jgi:hypothetical protein